MGGKKILAHSAYLRSIVLQYQATRRPLNFSDWNQFHVASWLHFNDKCANAALHALQSKLTGFAAIKMEKADIVKALGGVGSVESEVAFRSIQAKKVAGASN